MLSNVGRSSREENEDQPGYTSGSHIRDVGNVVRVSVRVRQLAGAKASVQKLWSELCQTLSLTATPSSTPLSNLSQRAAWPNRVMVRVTVGSASSLAQLCGGFA